MTRNSTVELKINNALAISVGIITAIRYHVKLLEQKAEGGNRTLVPGATGLYSTIKLHPPLHLVKVIYGLKVLLENDLLKLELELDSNPQLMPITSNFSCHKH